MSIKKIYSEVDEVSGEVLKHFETNQTSRLGGDWIVMYQSAITKLVTECPKLSIMKVYLTLAGKQTFGTHVVVTISALAKELELDYKTTWAAVKWLEDNQYIKREVIDGVTAFLLNPNHTTKGKDSLPEKTLRWSMSFGSSGK